MREERKVGVLGTRGGEAGRKANPAMTRAKGLWAATLASLDYL